MNLPRFFSLANSDRTGGGATAHPAAVHDECQDDSHHHGSRQRLDFGVAQEGLEFGGGFGDDNHWWGLHREG
jgi:hypothetical protein